MVYVTSSRNVKVVGGAVEVNVVVDKIGGIGAECNASHVFRPRKLKHKKSTNCKNSQASL